MTGNKCLTIVVSMLGASFLFVVACDSKSSEQKETSKSQVTAAAPLPESVFLKEEPAGAKVVEDVKKTAKVGDIVSLRGKVGGSKEPFVEGRAVFTVMGPGLKSCDEGSDMPSCATPWDYCCDTSKEIAAHSATIQIVDANGAPLRAAVRGTHGIKELSQLIVVGKVKQADDTVLLVDATGIFVAEK